MLTPIRVRKRPVEILAIRWTGVNYDAVNQFTAACFRSIVGDPPMTAEVFDDLHATWVSLRTGDWVLRGVKGEFYPCEESVFAETYDVTQGEPA